MHPLASLAPFVLALTAQELPLDRRRTPVVEVVERVRPAVVSITTNVTRQAWPYLFDSPGPSGTGVVIYEDGFIITNFHVVNGATEIQVRFDESVPDALIRAGGYDPELGARPMRRTVGREVESLLAGLVLRGELRPGDSVRLVGHEDKVWLEQVPPEAREAHA